MYESSKSDKLSVNDRNKHGKVKIAAKVGNKTEQNIKRTLIISTQTWGM